MRAALLVTLATLLSSVAGAQNGPRELRVGAGWIHDDWKKAREVAKHEGKPLFVVFRCVP